jgi:hypothetical protein
LGAGLAAGRLGRWGLEFVAGRFLSPPNIGPCSGQPNEPRWLSSPTRSPGRAEFGPGLTRVVTCSCRAKNPCFVPCYRATCFLDIYSSIQTCFLWQFVEAHESLLGDQGRILGRGHLGRGPGRSSKKNIHIVEILVKKNPKQVFCVRPSVYQGVSCQGNDTEQHASCASAEQQ